MESILFLGFTLNAWIVIVTVLLVFILMLCTKLPADFVFLGAMTVLMVTGTLPVNEVLAGFSSSSVVLVGALFVVIAGLVHTGTMQWIVKYALGTPKSLKMAILQLMVPVAVLSSFLSNTTVVAIFIKVVKIWSKKLNIAPSKLLIPLSYASGMGGICTLIGTPPNLLISGFYTEQTGIQLSIFTPTLVGLFCLAVGILSMIAMQKMVPVRKSPEDALVSSLILLAMILLSSLNVILLLQASFLAAFAMIICRCCSIDQARKSIDWGLLMVFAGSISLGSAIEYTGIANRLAEGILSVCGTNPMYALACICLLGTFITEFTSNTATAAIFFPITYNIATTLNVNPLTFCVALMIAVSSSFATPIGSPTHMLVYGPGGYRFSDFMRVGFFMNLIIWAASLFITPLLFPL